MRRALPNGNNDMNDRNALAILSSFASKLMATMKRSHNERPPGERERDANSECDEQNASCCILLSHFSRWDS